MPKPYSSVRDDLHTGDLLLFQGAGPLSLLIRGVTRSRFSHVGLVWRIPGEDLVLCFESTSLGGGYSGVRLNPLSARMREYRDGLVAWRALRSPLTAEESETLGRFRRRHVGKPYEEDKLDLIAAAFSLSQEEDVSSFFCSELVAEALQAIGRIDAAELSDNYTPEDFVRHPLWGELVEIR